MRPPSLYPTLDLRAFNAHIRTSPSLILHARDAFNSSYSDSFVSECNLAWITDLDTLRHAPLIALL